MVLLISTFKGTVLGLGGCGKIGTGYYCTEFYTEELSAVAGDTTLSTIKLLFGTTVIDVGS